MPLLSSSSKSDSKMKLSLEKGEFEIKLAEIHEDRLSARKDLIEIDKVARLNSIVKESDNHSLKNVKTKYSSFFDDESGNNTKEGLKQLYDELNYDYKQIKKQEQNLKAKLDEVNSKLESLNSSNTLLIFVTRSLNFFKCIRSLIAYAKPYFSLLLTAFFTIFSFMLIFTDLYMDVSYFIHMVENYIQSIIKYEILVSLSLGI